MNTVKKWLLKMLRGPFEFLNKLPWTKPIAILYALTFLVVYFFGWLFDKDVPPNLTQMGIWFGGAVFALATGKSVIEKNMGHEPSKGCDDGIDKV